MEITAGFLRLVKWVKARGANVGAYLIIVTGTMGGARVKIFCQV